MSQEPETYVGSSVRGIQGVDMAFSPLTIREKSFHTVIAEYLPIEAKIF